MEKQAVTDALHALERLKSSSSPDTRADDFAAVQAILSALEQMTFTHDWRFQTDTMKRGVDTMKEAQYLQRVIPDDSARILCQTNMRSDWVPYKNQPENTATHH